MFCKPVISVESYINLDDMQQRN